MNLGLFAAMMFFGFMATEGTIEYFLGTLFDKVTKLTPYKWALMYISAALGIFLSFHYGLDVPYMIFGLPASPVGVVLTGIVMGRGANFVNDIWQKFLN